LPGEARRRRLRALLKRADVDPKAIDLVEEAFVHESAARATGDVSNERLEFLGETMKPKIASPKNSRRSFDATPVARAALS
jgi:dsRNA-specific ribonuclease